MRRLLVAFALAGLLCGGGARAQTPAEPVTLRVGVGLDDQSKPIFYALQAGLFRKAGLDVQLVTLTGGGAAIAAAIAGGSLDLGKSNVLELISAHVRGLPFTLVAPGAGTGAFDHNGAIIVGTKSPLKTGRDLNGKTVAVLSLVTIQSIAVRAWIDANGGDSSTVHFLEVPPSATQAALDQGRVDAASVLEPILSQSLSTGNVRALSYPYGAIAPRFDGADYFTTTDFVAKHRDAVDRFVRAIHDANGYVTAHESETNALVGQYAKIDPALLEHMSHSERPAYLEAAAIQPLIDMAARYKFIAKTFPAQELISDAALKPSR